MKVTDPTYLRIRAACCEEHGLKDKQALDDHAAHITSIVLKAKKKRRAA